MKPNFALKLSHEDVTLLQRGSGGWLLVGKVAFSDGDVDGAIASLRARADALAPDGVTTKLLIPPTEVLTCKLNAPGPDDDSRRAQIEAALEGRTPYPVEELVFDWQGDGPEVDVAVVARETLIEAEDFATQRGFNPLSFAATPQSGDFVREAFFGGTRHAVKLLGDRSLVQPDHAPLKIIGDAPVPDPAPVEVRMKPAPPSDETAVPPPAPTTMPGPDSASPKGTSAPPASVAQTGTTPDAAVASPTPTKPNTNTSETPETDAAKSSSDTANATQAAKQAASTPASPTFQSRRTVPFDPRKAAAATGEKIKEKPTGVAALSAGRVVRMGARAKDALARRAGSTSAVVRGGLMQAQTGWRGSLAGLSAAIGKKPSDTSSPKGPKDEKAASARVDPPKTTASEEPKGAAEPVDISAKSASKSQSSDTIVTKKTGKANNALQSGASANTTGWNKPARGPEAKPGGKPLASASSSAPPLVAGDTKATGKTPSAEAERLTIFGARQSGMPKTRRSRRGAMAAGGIVLLLIAVGIWALYLSLQRPGAEFADNLPFAGEDQAQISPPAPVELSLSEDIEAIEGALGLEDAAQQPPQDDTDLSAAPATDLAGSVDPGQMSQPAPQSEPEPTTTDDTLAVQSLSPPRDGAIAGVRSSTLVAPTDTAALPPPSPSPPAPFGADPLPPLRGSPEALALSGTADTTAVDETTDPAEAVAETATAPDSDEPFPNEADVQVTVTEGRPAVTPQSRPASLSPAAGFAAARERAEAEAAAQAAAEAAAAVEAILSDLVAETAEAEADVAVGVTDGPPPVSPPSRPQNLALPGSSLPETLIAPEESDTPLPQSEDEAALEAPPGGVTLAALRPVPRPENLAERIAAAPTPETEPEAFDNATSEAVAFSLRPSSRPSDFNNVVARIQAAAQPAPQVQQVAAAPAATAAPQIPTSASVAREATQARAINLRQINLIGVMGSPSNRRALVRLSNGRIVTVSVGDSLDSGQVTAIGEAELRYTRRGRNLVLQLAS